jgi:GAF domain-containing protein
MSDSTLTREQVLLAVHERTIAMIASGAPLSGVLDELCRAVDALIPGVISTVLVMDPDGKRLWSGGAPRFPDALRPAINPWWIGPGRGSCGTAAFLKERVIIGDVTTDANFPEEYRTLAVKHGLRASWSQPLLTSAGTVLGTFAMYYGEPRLPTAADLELIDALGRIALVAIRLERSHAALRDGADTLSTLNRRLIDAEGDERTRLARRLHDDISQRLAALSARLDRLTHASDPAPVDEEIGAASEEIGDLGRDIRALSHRLQ